jgi:beta-ribofuranosylaminobenzene 5'-phosphate synthase
MMRIRTGSRLHFGLLMTGGAAGRRFGGVGLMIDEPGMEITAEAADAWSVEGPLADRADTVLRHVLAAAPRPVAAGLSFRIRRAAPEHAGLGTGTQLSLAIACLVAEAQQWTDRRAPALASLAGRGARSAVGIHGFDRGGLLVEGGKREEGAIAPLVFQHPFPPEWRIVLAIPRGEAGLHGNAEREVFSQMDAIAPSRTPPLCRLTLMGILPALLEKRFAEFSESLYDFNRLAGDLFRTVQGGPYSKTATPIVEAIRRHGVVGVGQSSWGPTVFAVTEDPERAARLAERLTANSDLPASDVLTTQARNRGAAIESES